MANEITEAGQIVVYGGPQLTLLGSDLGNALKSLLAREGSGAARGWKLFDPSKADYLNTKKVLNPGDAVLVNAKALPLSFPVQVAGGGVGSTDTIPLQGPDGETTTEYLEDYQHTSTATPTVAFASGAGTVQYSTDNNNWGNLPASIPAGTRYYLRVQHPNNSAFSATVTLTYA